MLFDRAAEDACISYFCVNGEKMLSSDIEENVVFSRSERAACVKVSTPQVPTRYGKNNYKNTIVVSKATHKTASNEPIKN